MNSDSQAIYKSRQTRLVGSPRAMGALALLLFVLVFQDVRILGSGIQGWQIIAGLGLFVLAVFSPTRRLTVNRVVWAWIALFIYMFGWTVIAYRQTGGLWIGNSADLWFGLSVLIFGLTLSHGLRRRWITAALIGYFSLNIAAGIVEVTLGHAAINAFHETKYSAGGRLRMLASEPSHVYAPFLVGIALLWELKARQRMKSLLAIGPFLVGSASKALLPVTFCALAISARIAYLRKIPRHARWVGRTLGVTIISLTMLVGIPAYLSIRSNMSVSREMFSQIDELPVGDISSILTRGSLFFATALAVSRHPILGVGPGRSPAAIFSQAEAYGLITPEILEYEQNEPKYITSKTAMLDLMVNYGAPAVLVLWMTFTYIFRRTSRKAILFAALTILVGAVVTQGYNIWCWLALCMLTIDLQVSALREGV